MKLDSDKFLIIAGPCLLENCDMSLLISKTLKKLCDERGFNYIFKGSFEKANRTCISSHRGFGIDFGINIFNKIRKTGIDCTTDVHNVEQVKKLSGEIDLVQIPAFLCRQTDLVLKCAQYFNAINIKKGQFASEQTMFNSISKYYIGSKGRKYTMITERGTFFGYNDLVVDMRNISLMKDYADYIIFDASHSCQKPGGSCTGGSIDTIGPLTAASIAAGANGIFFETHPEPWKALSDRDTQIELKYVEHYIDTYIVPYVRKGVNHK